MQNFEQTRSCPPVLFLIFNRPDLTQRVFARIREARPTKLFVAADGPRSDHPGEEQICAVTRRVVDQVDWPCELNTLFREHHLGCKQAVSSAITWFFDHIEEGIILEDDCLPEPSFFPFCAELLERFRDDNRVFMVSGRNDLGTWKLNHYSYFFTVGNIWGWATWKRAWQYFDPDIKLWTDAKARNNMRVFGQSAPYLAKEITYGCESVLQKKTDSWGYPWAFVRIAHRGLGAIPSVNMVANIGFSEDATHTTSSDSPYVNVPVYAMQYPLRHNPDVRVDFEYFEQCHKAMQGPVSGRVKERSKTCYRKLWNLFLP